MIGNGYWATGIFVRHVDGGWTATVRYYDDGSHCDDPDIGRVSTEGELKTRNTVRDGKHTDALTVAIDTVKADAESLGITWFHNPRPRIYMGGDPHDLGGPDGWRELLQAQACRIGWEWVGA